MDGIKAGPAGVAQRAGGQHCLDRDAAVKCDDAVQRYLDYLSADFAITPSENGCYVITPFARPDGEAIELAIVSLPNGAVRFSDMGDTLGYLYTNGLTLTRSVLDKARHIARKHRVSLQQSSLLINAGDSQQGDEVHRLLQAVLEVSNLVQGRSSAGRVGFDTEVEAFIIRSGVVYDVDFEVSGQREPHIFRFYVNSGRNLLIQPITAASESAAHSWAERWAYRFADTIAQSETWRPVAVLDDRGGRNSVWTTRARTPIGGNAVLWEDREGLSEMLGA